MTSFHEGHGISHTSILFLKLCPQQFSKPPVQPVEA